jgi:putative ABC transport system permease protein
MAAQPRLAGYAAGNYGQVSVDGVVVPAIGLDPVRGAGYLTLLAGRAPARPDEIALGTQTLRDVGARLGQRVQVVMHGRPRRMRIVGVTVLAGFGLGTVVTTDLGSGAVVSARALSTPAPQSGCPARFTCYNFMLARYQAGTGMAGAATRLEETIARLCPPQACTVTADQRPGEIRHYASVRDTPALLGALLALLAVGTLSHVLLTSVRRRRRDFAVLRVLGLVRAQVLAVVTWQGLTVTLIALVAGIPLGLLAGRWAWVLFAAEAGVRPGATIPVPLVLLAVPATLVLAAALAVWPGRAAVRAWPAAALRAE